NDRTILRPHKPRGHRLSRRADTRKNGNAVLGQPLERFVAKPVDIAQHKAVGLYRSARSDDDAPRRRVEFHHEERLALGPISTDTESAPLPGREIDDAVVMAQDSPVEMNDLSRPRGTGSHAPNHRRVASLRHEADVLAVRLAGNA